MIESEILHKLAAGASGSALGVWLAKITGWDRLVSFVGGVVCSQLFTAPLVDYFRLMKYEGATAFVVGLLPLLSRWKLSRLFSNATMETPCVLSNWWSHLVTL